MSPTIEDGGNAAMTDLMDRACLVFDQMTTVLCFVAIACQRMQELADLRQLYEESLSRRDKAWIYSLIIRLQQSDYCKIDLSQPAVAGAKGSNHSESPSRGTTAGHCVQHKYRASIAAEFLGSFFHEGK
eukprot:3843480-Amphidinium_carterae.2